MLLKNKYEKTDFIVCRTFKTTQFTFIDKLYITVQSFYLAISINVKHIMVYTMWIYQMEHYQMSNLAQ